MSTQFLVIKTRSGLAAASPAATSLRVRLFRKSAPNVVAFTSNEVRERTVQLGYYLATFTALVAADDYDYTLEPVAGGAPLVLGDCQFVGTDGETATDIPFTSGLTEGQATQLTAIAAAIAGGAIESTGRIASGGVIIAYVGDDFRVRSTTALTILVSDPAGGLFDLLSDIGEANLAWGASLPGRAAGLITGTIESLSQSGSGADTLCNITIEISDCGVGLKVSDDYVWQIESTQTHSTETDTHIRVEGTLSLRRNVVS